MAEPTPIRPPRLHEGRFKSGEAARNVWRVNPEHGTLIEAMLDRNYWVNVARNLRIGDVIEIIPDGQAWYARLFVGYVEISGAGLPLAADVSLLEFVKLDFVSKPLSADFDIEWKGPGGKYTVINKMTKSVLSNKHESKELAAHWLEDHLRKSVAA